MATEREIFVAAIQEDDASRRRVLLDDYCGVDSTLRQRIEKLLLVYDQAGSFLLAPVAEYPVTVDQPVAGLVGSHIGPYKLLQQIGEGGMGAVYMAEQMHPVQRKVALKLIKSGLDSRQVIARFEAERQALALMDHPNIAKVLDAGTTDAGQPYFVMELVHGVPITAYCDERRLLPRKRLELFVPVCLAVQHAHQKGIIHRDLKPSNVMIALYDGQPVPKVIDFGVAKATGSKLTEHTMFTEFGSIIGTLEYMSPEQAERNQLDVDTRSDVYSLGVLLYELLTGTTPLDKNRSKNMSVLELLRIIKEEEPPNPSTRLGASGSTAVIAACRDMEPASLTRLVRGELDWIVMKALDKDRTRRYESVSALAADLGRYLNDEPVLACPPTPAYRISKFVRRNRGPVAAAALLLCSLVLGVVVSTWLAIWAFKAESLAEQQSKAERSARQDADAQRLQAELNLRSARQAVDEYLTLVSEDILLEQPELQSLRKRLLESALKYYEAFVERGNQAPQVQVELAAAYFRVGQIYAAVDSPDASLAALSQCLDLVEKLQGNPACTPEMWKVLAGIHKGARPFHVSTRPITDRAQALAILQRAVVLWKELAQRHPGLPEFHSDLASLCVSLGELQADLGQRHDAISSLGHACDLLESRIHQTAAIDDRAELSHAYGRLGLHYENVGNRDDAAAVRRQAVRLAQGLASEAARQPYLADLLANSYSELGNTLAHTNPREAQQALQQSLAMYRKLVGEFPMVPAFRERLAIAWFNLANLCTDNDQTGDATSALREAVAIMERLAADAPSNSDCKRRLAKYQYTLGHSLRRFGQSDDASQAYRQALRVRRELVADFPAVARYHEELAWQLATCPHVEVRDPPAAVTLAQKAVELSPQNATCWKTLGVAQYRAGNCTVAIEALERSRQLPTFNRSLDWFLAMAHYRIGNVARARQHYEQARTWMEQNRPHDEELLSFRAEAAELQQIDDTLKSKPE